MTYQILGKFLPANISINIAFRWNFDLLNILIEVAMLLQALPVFTLHILYIQGIYHRYFTYIIYRASTTTRRCVNLQVFLLLNSLGRQYDAKNIGLYRADGLSIFKNCSVPQMERLRNAYKMYLKVVSATFLLVCVSSLKERTLETRKNVFYFSSKAFFVLEKVKVQNLTYLNFMTSSNALSVKQGIHFTE